MRSSSSRIGTGLARKAFSQFGRRSGETAEAQFFATVERTTPVRPPALESDVLVPAASGLLMGVCTFSIITPIAVGILNALEYDPIAGVFAGLVSGGVGFWLMAYDALIKSRTSIYATDVLRDNLLARSVQAEQSEHTTSSVELTVVREDVGPYPVIKKRELPVDEDRLREFALATLEGEPLTQVRWVGGDKPFSRSEFDQMMEMLMELGLVAWNSSRDNAQGRTLTRGGAYALRAWLQGRVDFASEVQRASAHASSQGVLEADVLSSE